MAKERIGLVGPGRMGLAMVRHLVRNGYPVTVTHVNPTAIKAAAEAGAVPDWTGLGSDLT